MAPQTSDPFKDGQNIRDRTFEFGCRIVNFCDRLYDRGGVARVMAPQLLRCGTSIPAMLEEARAAESRRDFISKSSISLKECRESWTRLRVCEACGIGPAGEASQLVCEANELVAIISSIIRNTRRRTASTHS